MNIIENLISGKNRPGTRIDVKYLVIHWTANTSKGADADANRNYFNRKSCVIGGVHYELGSNDKFRAASAHYLVDDKKIVRALPENEMGYHVGAKSYRHPSCRNSNSVGIEMCVNSDGDFAKMRANTVELAADFCKRHGINPATNMIRHYDVTGKDCPHFYVVDPAGWAQFRNDVAAKMKGEVVPAPKVEKAPATNVQAEIITKPATEAKPETNTSLPTGVLKLGDKGAAVKMLQNALNSVYFKCGTADGIYGAKTADAVLRFQKQYGIKPYDGIYGPKTRAKLAEVLK